MFTHKTLPLSELVAGHDVDVVRDRDIAYVCKIPNPLEERLVACGNSKHIKEALALNGIAAIITTPELAEDVPPTFGLAVCSAPYLTSLYIYEELAQKDNFLWHSFPSRISDEAIIHPSAFIDERDVIIGKGTVVQPGAIIRERSIIGENCVIGAGTVIGAGSFQIFKNADRQRIIAQAGGVRLGDRVELQSNCSVSRAVFGGFTEIGDETLIDNQVHVSHDCIIGRKVVITHCVSLAGRIVLEDGVYVGPNATISNGLTIEEEAQITIGSTVLRNVEAGLKVTGYGAQPHKAWKAQQIRDKR
ncbi:MAG: UDP-3-O-(3-hydroxymyristoyl)glucosamine N-acyltransferase [Lentilitoribacter sp.]